VHKHNEMPHETVMRRGRAIDFAHLDQYTLGDEALQGELLRLFSMQLEAQMGELLQCADAGTWKQATHTLKGAARAVGVWQVAEVAERLEGRGFDGGVGDASDLAELRAAAAEFKQELARLME
jgi:chemotaxis protein histidine kinase CheA